MKGMKKYERKNKQKGFTVSSAPSGFTVDYICLLVNLFNCGSYSPYQSIIAIMLIIRDRIEIPIGK